jgi:hypothetical protein
MNKKRFFTRIGIVIAGCLVLWTAVFYIRYSKYPLRSLALVHISNSISYNSNIQNLVLNTDIDKIEYMILGSSISLNNLSAKMIEDTFQRKTYNLSSWGFPVTRAIDFFNIIHPQHCRNVLVAFNNIDFVDNPGIKYNFKETKYFLQGNKLVKLLVVLKTFNFSKFDDDTKYKDSTVQRSPLDFGTHGSALLNPLRFPRDDNKLPVYKDTTGFQMFYKHLQQLKALLKENNCTLSLLYVPYRSDILSEEQFLNNDLAAAQLKIGFGKEFIDFHRRQIADSLYWDGAHLYKDGAIMLTKMMLAEMNKK